MARIVITLVSLVLATSACAEKPGTKKADDKEAKDGKDAKAKDGKTETKTEAKDAKPGG